MTVISDADTYVSNSESTVNTNYGTMTNLLVDGSPQQEGLVRFTVGGIQGGVVSAKLRLYVRIVRRRTIRLWRRQQLGRDYGHLEQSTGALWQCCGHQRRAHGQYHR